MADVTALIAKLEWADKHIVELQEVRDVWAEAQHNRVRSQDDPNTGDRTYWIDDAILIPDPVPLLVGDAVHNLRSGLDHLAHRLMVVATNSRGPFPHVYFPIGENASKYKTEARRRINGARDGAMKAIEAIQPYGGGAGEILWHLHSLDIIDKHQLLIAVGSANLRHSMSPTHVAGIKKRFLNVGLEVFTPVQDARAFMMASKNPSFPLKTGHKLAVIPKAEVSDEMHFAFEIAFGEPKVLAGDSVIETLSRMKQKVYEIIRDFDIGGLFG
jgi:hypothetical protein